jgi:hypothetical protein
MTRPPGNPPQGPNHALLIGMVAGLCATRFDTEILDTPDGIHTDQFLISRPSGLWRIIVSPEDVAAERL